METNEHSISDDYDADTDRQLLSVSLSMTGNVAFDEVAPERLQTLFCVYRL